MDQKKPGVRKKGRRRCGLGTIWAVICATLFIVYCGQTFAQAGVDTGSVTGTVKDPSKALVVGAKCTLTNTATGVSQRVFSTSAGAYTFPVVQVGSYSLTVVKPGFKDSVLDGIVVHLGSTVTADVALQVGAASMEVTVTTAAPLLQAQDASLGMTVDSTMANDLPLFGGSGGRNFMDLATIAAGVQFTGSAVNTNTFLVHGVESGQVDVRLNGADDNAEVFGGVTIPPIPDAIQEFKLEDGNNSADLGHSYGAVVSVATKQGTNQLKGSAWEYNENDMFNANDYFNKLHQLVTGTPKLPNRPGRYKENSFGGLIGGPVILPHLYNGHNRTFFTVDYQATFYTSSSTFTGTVPTENMANSNFSDLSDTLTLSNQGATSNPQTSEKEDALGRWFQVGMMLDPATTREVPCGTNDPITGLPTNCKVGYAPTINGKQYAILRDPFISGAAGCPSLHGTTIFNSSYNKANGSQTTYAPTCFNQLPAGRLDPNAVALLKMFPAPNQPAITYGNNYLVTHPGTYNTQQYDVRIDHTISPNDSVLGTFSHYNSIVHPTPPFPGVIEGGSNVGFWTTNPTYMVVLTETHVFTPNLINEFRASDEHNWNTRMDPGAIDTTYGTPGQYGIQGIPQTTDNGGLPTFTVDSGISSFGSRTNTTWQKVGAWQFSDNITKMAGKHQLKFGGEVNLTYGDIVQLPYSRGSFTYNGEFSNTPNSGDTDTGLADFLLVPSQATSTYAAAGGVSTGTNLMGGLDAYAGDNWTKSTYHSPYVALYVVDTWKATPNFTVNVGLREEHFAPYSSEGGQEANFWMGGSDGNQPSGSTYYIAHDGCNTPMSPSFTGLLSYDNIPIVCQPHNTANEMPRANWAPRVGLAYRIRPNLVARLGGGIAYGAFGSVGYGGTLGQNYPFLFTVKSGSSVNPYTPQLIGAGGNSTTATMENTFDVINMDNPLAAYIPLGSAVMYGKQYHYKVPNVTTLTAALQWQFTNHDSIEGRYVGNVGRHLDTLGPYHNAPRELLTTNTSAVTACSSAQLSANPYCENTPAMANGDGNVVPFPNMSLNTLMDPTNQISNYQSAEAEYRHQFIGGFTMDSNYTFTRCWADTQAGEQNAGDPTNGRAPMVLGFGGYRADYDRCSNLAAHIFRLSGEYNLPIGEGAPWVSNVNGWENAIIGGWKLDPIWIASSGTLNNVTCQGTNGYGANPTFTGPWFQTGSTDWVCEATTEPGQPLYGPGPKDKPRTKINGYWNSSAFTAPEEAVQANGQLDFTPLGGRGNQLYGPGWYNINLAIHKQFKTTDATRLEIQGQAMNLFNHMEPSNPSTSTYTTPTSESLTGGWGTVSSTRLNNGEGRIWQFVGKFYF